MVLPVRFSLRGLWLLIVVVATLALLFMAWNAPWRELGRALSDADLKWLLLALAANLAIYPLWIWQWRLLASGEADVAFGRMANIVCLTALANVTLVKVAGTASAGLLLVSRAKLSIGGASSVMLLDQLLVGIVKVLLLFLLFAVVPLPQEVVLGGLTLSLLVVALGVVVTALIVNPAPLQRYQDNAHSWVATAASWLQSASKSLQGIRRPGMLLAVLAIAIGKKSLEILAAYAIQLACGLDPSWTAALLVVGAVSIATTVPLTPGSIGVYSAAIYAVYIFTGQTEGPAMAAAVLQHVVELVPAIVLGYAALLTSSRRPRPVQQ